MKIYGECPKCHYDISEDIPFETKAKFEESLRTHNHLVDYCAAVCNKCGQPFIMFIKQE